jgi:hypothetical protein
LPFAGNEAQLARCFNTIVFHLLIHRNNTPAVQASGVSRQVSLSEFALATVAAYHSTKRIMTVLSIWLCLAHGEVLLEILMLDDVSSDELTQRLTYAGFVLTEAAR